MVNPSKPVIVRFSTKFRLHNGVFWLAYLFGLKATDNHVVHSTVNITTVQLLVQLLLCLLKRRELKQMSYVRAPVFVLPRHYEGQKSVSRYHETCKLVFPRAARCFGHCHYLAATNIMGSFSLPGSGTSGAAHSYCVVLCRIVSYCISVCCTTCRALT